MALNNSGQIDIVVEATGVPSAGLAHALAAFANGCSVVMVTVEADALVGPLLVQKAREAGVALQLGLWRPTCFDLRSRRLGADLRVECRLRGKGHEISPGISHEHARHGLGLLRPHRASR